MAAEDQKKRHIQRNAVKHPLPDRFTILGFAGKQRRAKPVREQSEPTPEVDHERRDVHRRGSIPSTVAENMDNSCGAVAPAALDRIVMLIELLDAFGTCIRRQHGCCLQQTRHIVMMRKIEPLR